MIAKMFCYRLKIELDFDFLDTFILLSQCKFNIIIMSGRWRKINQNFTQWKTIMVETNSLRYVKYYHVQFQGEPMKTQISLSHRAEKDIGFLNFLLVDKLKSHIGTYKTLSLFTSIIVKNLPSPLITLFWLSQYHNGTWLPIFHFINTLVFALNQINLTGIGLN